MEGNGPFIRAEKLGSEIKANKLQKVTSGDFIYSRLFAWKGAFGLIPKEMDGAYVSNEFPTFKIDTNKVLPKFLDFYFKQNKVWRKVEKKCTGTTKLSRNRFKEKFFLEFATPYPSKNEQNLIVNRIEKLTDCTKETIVSHEDINKTLHELANNTFQNLVQDAEYLTMKEVSPIVRRKIEIDPSKEYYELGIRSHGNGTFHKPSIAGSTIKKRLYKIEKNDLVFNNVFAWEGAVAVAKPEDYGRVGSHRFITCIPKKGVITSSFLCFYFLTTEGLRKLGKTSPGGAGRNRTLGLKKLEQIKVPVPGIEKQIMFDSKNNKIKNIKQLNSELIDKLNEIMPSFIHQEYNLNHE